MNFLLQMWWERWNVHRWKCRKRLTNRQELNPWSRGGWRWSQGWTRPCMCVSVCVYTSWIKAIATHHIELKWKYCFKWGEEDSNLGLSSSCSSSSRSIHAVVIVAVVVVVVVVVVVLVAFGIVVVAAVTEEEVKTLYWYSGLWLCIHTNKICGS